MAFGSKSLTQTLLGTLVDFLEDSRDALTGDDTRKAIVADLGGDPSSSSTAPQFPPAGLASAKAYRDSAEPGLEGLMAAIQDVRATIDILGSFVDSLDLGVPGDLISGEPHDDVSISGTDAQIAGSAVNRIRFGRRGFRVAPAPRRAPKRDDLAKPATLSHGPGAAEDDLVVRPDAGTVAARPVRSSIEREVDAARLDCHETTVAADYGGVHPPFG